MKIEKRTIEQVKAEPQFRTFQLDTKSINVEERTVPLAFSSEDPYMRWFGYEVLDHSPDSVDLSRLNNDAPFLFEHDRKIQLGKVMPGTAVIDTDRIGRVVVKFGKTQKADEEFQEVIDGIRTKISVGYKVIEMVLDGKKDEIEIYRVTKWEPYEVSLVSIPADDTVGVGKSDEIINQPQTIGISKMDPEEEKRIKEQEEREAEQQARRDAQQKEAEMEKARKDAQKSETHRIRAINAATAAFLAKGFDFDEIAQRHIADGSSCETFLQEMTKAVREKQAAIRPDLDLGLNQKEVKSYKLYKALKAQISGNWKDAGFERECSIEIAERLGKDPRGTYIPPDVQLRAQNTGTPSAGGNLVATELNHQSFIHLLRDNSVIDSLGVTYLYGLQGNQTLPKQQSSSTAYWVDEGGDGIDSEMTFALLTMSPKTLTAAVPITRRMQLQATPDIEMLTWNDMAKVLALALDAACFEGDGLNNKPLGITNTAGVNVQTIATPGAPSYNEMVGFETALAIDNNLHDALHYVTTAAVRGKLKTTMIDPGSGLRLMMNKVCNDYPVILKNSLTLHRILFGYFADLLIGYWSVLDAVADTSTLIKSGGFVARFFQDLDVLVRQPESFCING